MSISPHSSRPHPIDGPRPAALRGRVSITLWLLLLACLALAGWAGAAWASADDPGPGERAPAPARVAGPDPGRESAAAGRPIATAPSPTTPVVTRALVRARIEAIDPARWLARFGPVEQSPTDAR